VKGIYFPPAQMALIYDKQATAVARPIDMKQQPFIHPKTRLWTWRARGREYKNIAKDALATIIAATAPWFPGQEYYLKEQFYPHPSGQIYYRLDYVTINDFPWLPARFMVEEWMARGSIRLLEVQARQITSFTEAEVVGEMKFHSIFRFVQFVETSFTGFVMRRIPISPLAWCYFLRFEAKRKFVPIHTRDKRFQIWTQEYDDVVLAKEEAGDDNDDGGDEAELPESPDGEGTE